MAALPWAIWATEANSGLRSGRRSRDAGADTSRCTRTEVLAGTGAASHRSLVFPALVPICGPYLFAFLAWALEHNPIQGSSLQLAPCRGPLPLTNSRLKFTYAGDHDACAR